MDDLERLIEAFRARSTWSVLSKLDALLDLEQLDDPRRGAEHRRVQGAEA
jgi:hypothetical protein